MSSWSTTAPRRHGYRPDVSRLALGALLLVAALSLPGVARAELVPGSAGAQDALLAIAPDGSPRAAFVAADGSLVVATRTADGIWSAQTVTGLPGPRVLVVGLAVSPDGVTYLLAEDPAGHWLALADLRSGSWQVRTVAGAPTGGLLGFGGLALDRTGHPLVAYPVEIASHKTWLRLVHESPAGRLVGERVTRAGFPESEALPAASPVVLPSGAVRVLEVYAGGAIEWARTKSKTDWIGQFVYGSSLGSPAGVVAAAAPASGGVWSAFTELFPDYGESQLVLAQHLAGEHSTVLHHHAFLVGLALGPGGPEVAADDYVDLGGARTVFAGVVIAGAGSVELGGDLEGYAIDAAGGRDYLLLEPAGLGWYRSPTAPAPSVTVAAAVSGASFALSGQVTGAAPGSTVELWRETEAGPALAATLPLAADGTFTTTDLPPARPLTYRVVYRDPATGLPLASLVRTVPGS